MSGERIVALVLLMFSVGCCVLGLIIGLTPAVVNVRLLDGTTATPGMGLLSGFSTISVALMLAIGSVILWRFVHPARRIEASHQAALDALRGIALQHYVDWVTAVRLVQVSRAAEHQAAIYQTIRSRTLAMLPTLDGRYKRFLLQFLYDSELIRYPAMLNLRGADLRESDLRGLNLQGVDLRGTDLRGAIFDQANLHNANLQGAQIRPENLATATSLVGTVLPDVSQNRSGPDHNAGVSRLPEGAQQDMDQNRSRPDHNGGDYARTHGR